MSVQKLWKLIEGPTYLVTFLPEVLTRVAAWVAVPVTNVVDSNITVCKFELRSLYYIYSQTNIFKKYLYKKKEKFMR